MADPTSHFASDRFVRLLHKYQDELGEHKLQAFFRKSFKEMNDKSTAHQAIYREFPNA